MIRQELDSRGRGAKARLAEAVGVEPQTVSKWVAGQTQPEMERWEAIEAHLGWERGEIVRHVMPVEGATTTIDLVNRLTAMVTDLAARVAALEAGVPGHQRRS